MNFDRATQDIALAAIVAAARPEQWGNLCDVIVESLDARAFMVFAYDVENHGASVAHASARLTSPEAAPLLQMAQTGQATEDYQGYETIGKGQPGRVFGEREGFGVAPGEPLPPNAFRDRVLSMTGGRSRSAMKVNHHGPFLDCAISHDADSGGHPSESLQAAAPFLVPLLARTLESSRIVSALASSYSALMTLFDRLDFGAVFCWPSGEIVTSNRTFAEIASECDGLTDGGGRLRSVLWDCEQTLRVALHVAKRPAAGSDLLTFTVSRRSGSLPLVCHIMPVAEPEVAVHPLLLVLVIDPESTRRLSARGLAAFGELSPAELDVCNLLVRGFSTEKIAGLRDTSTETTRGQIKVAAAKLACRGRMDLLRLALATSYPLRDDSLDPPSGG